LADKKKKKRAIADGFKRNQNEETVDLTHYVEQVTDLKALRRVLASLKIKQMIQMAFQI